MEHQLQVLLIFILHVFSVFHFSGSDMFSVQKDMKLVNLM